MAAGGLTAPAALRALIEERRLRPPRAAGGPVLLALLDESRCCSISRQRSLALVLGARDISST